MHAIKKIREEQGTPFYLYDGTVLSEQAAWLRKTFSGFGILFSVKANPFPPLLQKIASLGIGADAASAKEVALALDAGISAENIYYSCPAPTREDLTQVIGHCHIIADSFHVLSLLEEAAACCGRKLAVGLRLHPAFTMDGSPVQPSKFGIEEGQLWAMSNFQEIYPHLTIDGLHVHLRSQVLDAYLLGNYYDQVMALAVRLQEFLGKTLAYINFGGGVGKVYDPEKQTPLDQKLLHDAVADAKKKYEKDLSARLLLESGRFLACDCGTYVTEIVDIKEACGKTYYIVKNGANGFFKPVLRQLLLSANSSNVSLEPFVTENDSYDIRIFSENEETETVDIVGHLCSGADVMAKDVLVKKGKIGDLVTFNHAGSYAYSLAPLLFASQPMPKQVFMDNP